MNLCRLFAFIGKKFYSNCPTAITASSFDNMCACHKLTVADVKGCTNRFTASSMSELDHHGAQGRP